MMGTILWKIQVVVSHEVLKCHLIEIIHFSVFFIPIHHSFGFPDIFPVGSRNLKDPPGSAPGLHYCIHVQHSHVEYINIRDYFCSPV